MNVQEWLQSIFDGISALQLIFWIAGLGAFIWLIVKLWPAISRFVDIIDAAVLLPQLTSQVSKLVAQVEDIHHETHFNDGSSIKDGVERLEKHFGTLPAEFRNRRPDHASSITAELPD